jgi:hypothetical protein
LAPHTGCNSNSGGIKPAPLEPPQALLLQVGTHEVGAPVQPGYSKAAKLEPLQKAQPAHSAG